MMGMEKTWRFDQRGFFFSFGVALIFPPRF